MTELATAKQNVYDYVNASLGGGMIDVELDPIHYETALGKALSKFRQRSDNSVEESYLFILKYFLFFIFMFLFFFMFVFFLLY